MLLEEKYFTFWVNKEVFVVEILELNKYDIFNVAINNTNFLKEDLKIEFPIESKLIKIAHDIGNHKNESLDLDSILKVYDYLNYLIPIDLENTIKDIIFQYKFKKTDKDRIIELDDTIYYKFKQIILKDFDFDFDFKQTSQYKKDSITFGLIEKIQKYVDNPVYNGSISLINWFYGPRYYEYNNILKEYINKINSNHEFINIEFNRYYFIDRIDIESVYNPNKKIYYKLTGSHHNKFYLGIEL